MHPQREPEQGSPSSHSTWLSRPRRIALCSREAPTVALARLRARFADEDALPSLQRNRMFIGLRLRYVGRGDERNVTLKVRDRDAPLALWFEGELQQRGDVLRLVGTLRYDPAGRLVELLAYLGAAFGVSGITWKFTEHWWAAAIVAVTSIAVALRLPSPYRAAFEASFFCALAEAGFVADVQAPA